MGCLAYLCLAKVGIKRRFDMRKLLKIAIFSGAIPSTTFIEYLIEGVAVEHRVLLFGVINTQKHYASKHITVYKTPKVQAINLIFTLYRLMLLLLSKPKAIFVLLNEIKGYTCIYDQWIWFSKFLPIVLYRPDVLHLQWARDLEFYAFLKTKFNIKLIVSLRGAHINYTPIAQPKVADVYKRTFPCVDAFHAVSKAIGQEAQLYGAQVESITVIHSPVPTVAFEHYVPFNKRNHSRFKIGSVGRFHWIKGMRYAIDACAILKARGFDFEYTCISTNALTETELFQMHQLQLVDDIQILGKLEQHELFERMKDFDVLLLPSLKEGIANVVLEAMALGIPVISADCGGMHEVVFPGQTGWLVPVRDAEAIADAIVEVQATTEVDLQRITKNAHDFVKTEFNSEDSIKQFLEMYESVVGDV